MSLLFSLRANFEKEAAKLNKTRRRKEMMNNRNINNNINKITVALTFF
jgi:hypothetical protein